MLGTYLRSIYSGAREFLELARFAFEYQLEHVEMYKKFVQAINPRLVKPGALQSLHEIPFMPIEVFKSHKIISRNFLRAETIFKSSGMGGARSEHHLADMALYESSFNAGFKLFYGSPSDYHILALLPSYLEQGDSSLVYMAERLIQASASPAGFFLYDHETLHQTLLRLSRSQKKVLLLGVSYALLDFAHKFPLSKTIKNLIVMETGGMKGRSAEISRSQLHRVLTKAFKCESIHSEYGMTELLSQAYSRGAGIFFSPPWMKVIIGDINDPLSSVRRNKTGQIKIIDLSNIYSCSFIQTQDVGVQRDCGGFEVLGRLSQAELRGCNLLLTS